MHQNNEVEFDTLSNILLYIFVALMGIDLLIRALSALAYYASGEETFSVIFIVSMIIPILIIYYSLKKNLTALAIAIFFAGRGLSGIFRDDFNILNPLDFFSIVHISLLIIIPLIIALRVRKINVIQLFKDKENDSQMKVYMKYTLLTGFVCSILYTLFYIYFVFTNNLWDGNRIFVTLYILTTLILFMVIKKNTYFGYVALFIPYFAFFVYAIEKLDNHIAVGNYYVDAVNVSLGIILMLIVMGGFIVGILAPFFGLFNKKKVSS